MRKIISKLTFTLWLVVVTMCTIPQQANAWFWDDIYKLVPGIKHVIKTDEWPSSSLLDTIKSTINWILGILATVALVICMYAWFKMLTSWGDSKWYDAWLKTLKNAALWLAIIWLSWLIVSAIIRFVKLQWWEWTMV
jgi:hypothetical protein